MKKFLAIILALATVLSLCSCAKVELNDKGFLANLQKALEARLSTLAKNPADTSSNAAYKSSLTEVMQKEKETIGDLAAYTFEDKQLEELAVRYMDALDSQLEGIKAYGSNDALYTELFQNKGYYERCSVIAKLYDEYGFSLNDKWKNELMDYIDDGEKADREKNTFAAMEALLSKDLTLTCEDAYYYTTEVTNPTDVTFSSVSFEASFYDADDKEVYSSSEYVTDWAPGKTTTLRFYCSDTFDHAQVSLSYYSDIMYVSHDTGKKDVNCKAFDPGVEIILVNELPAEFTSKYWYHKNTCVVTDFSYTFSYYSDGKSSFNVALGGSKTDDRKGANNSSYCCIDYKLTNEDKTIVFASGSFYTSELTVGQSFVDCDTYISGLAAGTYYMELTASDY